MSGSYELISKRCDRAIAIILSLKERECDQYLPSDAQYQLRKVVLDQLNELKEFTKDLLDTFAESHVIANQIYLERIEAQISNNKDL